MRRANPAGGLHSRRHTPQVTARGLPMATRVLGQACTHFPRSLLIATQWENQRAFVGRHGLCQTVGARSNLVAPLLRQGRDTLGTWGLAEKLTDRL